VNPLEVLVVGAVLFLAALIRRVVARRPRHIRPDSEWRGALDRVRRRQARKGPALPGSSIADGG
jgi:hypothetical protein